MPEQMIEHLKRNLELAPQLQQNNEDGGSIEALVEKCKEQINKCGGILPLQKVEGGVRRYRNHMGEALAHLEALIPLYGESGATKGGKYSDGEQRQKAMGRLKDHGGKIKGLTEQAIAAINAGLAVVYEGEGKAVRK